MAFFDKLGEITKNVGDKTNDMIEINKLNSKIKTERTAIETVKAELGALYWAKFVHSWTMMRLSCVRKLKDRLKPSRGSRRRSNVSRKKTKRSRNPRPLRLCLQLPRRLQKARSAPAAAQRLLPAQSSARNAAALQRP